MSQIRYGMRLIVPVCVKVVDSGTVSRASIRVLKVLSVRMDYALALWDTMTLMASVL